MSERNKPHNGRDRSGHFKVRREDVLRLARVVTDILSLAQGRRAARERAA